MARTKKSAYRLGEGSSRGSGKQKKSTEETARRVETRGSSEKRRRDEKKDEKRKGKRQSKVSRVVSDSDFESDDGSKDRRSKYTSSDSEESDTGRDERVRKHARREKQVQEIKPENCFAGVEVDFSETYYRSNLRTTINDLKGITFTNQHIVHLKKTPFWLLFNSVCLNVSPSLKNRCLKFESDIVEIVRRFDFETESFVIGGTRVALSKLDAELIFGISCGTDEIRQRVDDYKHPPWVMRCFGSDILSNPRQYNSLYKLPVLLKLKEVVRQQYDEANRDVARLVCCYMLVALLCPVRSSAVPWHLTHYLENFSEICRYDWSTFIVDQLKIQLKRSKHLKSGGCAMLLPFWLCEHTRIVRPNNPSAFPRFLKWDTNKVHAAILTDRLTRRTRVFTEEPKPTTDEKEQLSEVRRFRCEETSSGLGGTRTPATDVKLSSGIAKSANELQTELNVAVGQSDIFQNSSSKVFEVGSSSGAKKSFTVECPSFDIGLDSEDPVMKVCKEINRENVTAGDLERADVDCNLEDIEEGNIAVVKTMNSGDKIDAPVSDVNKSTRVDNYVVEIGLLQKKILDVRVRCDQELMEKDVEIQKLKTEKEEYAKRIEESASELNNMKKEFEDVVARFDKESRIKDDVIISLKAENQRLSRNLEITSEFCSKTLIDEDVFQEDFDSNAEQTIIEQSVDKGKITVEELNEEVLKTPKRQVKKKTTNISPSSLVERIKGRTIRDDRRPMIISPQPLTKELVVVHELNDDNDDASKNEDLDNKPKGVVKYPFNNKLATVRKCSKYVRDQIFEELKTNGPHCIVWHADIPLADVSVQMLIDILNNGLITSQVINAWADILRSVLFTSRPESRRVRVFTATCWAMITNRKISKQRSFYSLVDKVIEDSLDKSIFLFPINVCAMGSSSGSKAVDHWTLLKLDLTTREWTFYNSLPPRTKSHEDTCLMESLNVVKFVDARLVSLFKEKQQNHPFLKMEFKYPIPADTWRQGSESVDCGVIVCKEIEYIYKGEDPQSGEFRKLASSTMRARIVESFVDSMHMSFD